MVEEVPNSVLLLHSFLVNVLDQTEKVIPSITPEQFRDDAPRMKPNLIPNPSPKEKGTSLSFGEGLRVRSENGIDIKQKTS
jgi:hypothetical protein